MPLLSADELGTLRKNLADHSRWRLDGWWHGTLGEGRRRRRRRSRNRSRGNRWRPSYDRSGLGGS
jgi:hypothetical protein